MNIYNNVSAAGRVHIVRTQENCEVRTRITKGEFGTDHEHITLRCPPLSLEPNHKERVHEYARQRTTARNR